MDNLTLTADKKDIGNKSFYNGDILSNVFFTVLGLIIRAATLDIAAPIVICMRLRWRAEHTYINGRRMYFCGETLDLMRRNTIWVLLSIVTFGIYIPFKMYNMKRWETEHLHFVGVSPQYYGMQKSQFRCEWYTYFGVNLLYFLGTAVTLGIAHIWLYTYREKFLTKCRIIDGHILTFDATVKDYFVKRCLWLLLSVVTFGIYGQFLKNKLLRWSIANTAVQSLETIPYYEDVAAEQRVRPVNKRAYFSFFALFPIALFMICAWLSKVVCRHGIHDAIVSVPLVFCILSICLTVATLLLAVRSYKFATATKTDKWLPVILISLTAVVLIVGVVLLGYIVYLII